MQSVILVIHLILALAIIAVVLIQRSEGGGLGIGQSGGMGGLATPRSTANLLTRLTAILAGCFMATSLLLAILASHSGSQKSILDTQPVGQKAQEAPAAAPQEPAKAPEVPISE